MKCKQCGEKIIRKSKFCTNCAAPVKRPFYMWWWFYVVIGVFILAGVITIAMVNKDRFNWKEIELCSQLPSPAVCKGCIYSNSGKRLSVDIYGVKPSDYHAYVNKCVEYGYTMDVETDERTYEAFNDSGYKLMLSGSYKGDKMSIQLNAPEKFSMVVWPLTGAGGYLPVPASNQGKVYDEKTDRYYVHMGNMSKEEFYSYVEKCERLGFVGDYERQNTYYEAHREDGYNIEIEYIGANVVSIEIEMDTDYLAVEEDTERDDYDWEEIVDGVIDIVEIVAGNNTSQNGKDDKTDSADKAEANSSAGLVDGMRPEFKEVMDTYEEFYDEYIDFMKKYMQNPTDFTLIADYAKMLERLSEMDQIFDSWNEDEMNAAELAYYLEVSSRVLAKTLTIYE